MTQAIAVEPATAPVALEIRPSRSITAAGLKGFFGLMAAASMTVAGFSFAQGNVFAPAFAVLELSLLAFCLRLVWRSLSQCERVVFRDGSIDVERNNEGLVARFNPHWVRVISEAGPASTDRRRLLLSSHGRAVEVGSFVGERERAKLEAELKQMIARCRVAPGI
jgi:uncharacterized membrane protein